MLKKHLQQFYLRTNEASINVKIFELRVSLVPLKEVVECSTKYLSKGIFLDTFTIFLLQHSTLFVCNEVTEIQCFAVTLSASESLKPNLPI